jgi:hypothetical protein
VLFSNADSLLYVSADVVTLRGGGSSSTARPAGRVISMSSMCCDGPSVM